MGTPFTEVYNRFLGKITDDMYVELTPQDTIRDLRAMLIEALPGFEFPRVNLFEYTIDQEQKLEELVDDDDFIIGFVWDDELTDEAPTSPIVVVEKSAFAATLTTEEINILAILMLCAWTQRQVTSIENVRMKYSGSDFKMTSQANHLQKLLTLLAEVQRQSHHYQRLYRRRKIIKNGTVYESNWDVLGKGVYYDRQV